MHRPRPITLLAAGAVLVAAIVAVVLLNRPAGSSDGRPPADPKVIGAIKADFVLDRTDILLAQVVPAAPARRSAVVAKAQEDVQAALAFSQGGDPRGFLDRRAEGLAPQHTRTRSVLRARMSAAYAASAAGNESVRLVNQMYHSVDDPSFEAVQDGQFVATAWERLDVTGDQAQATVVGYSTRSIAGPNGRVRQVTDGRTRYVVTLVAEDGRWRIAESVQTDLGAPPS